VKLPHRPDAEDDENCHHGDLRDREWRLGLGRRQGLQKRQFLEGLNHAHEAIQIEGQHRADHVNPSPETGESPDIERENRDGEHRERQCANNLRRPKACEGKQEAGGARQDGRREKDRG
jgi:hypothetical protein